MEEKVHRRGGTSGCELHKCRGAKVVAMDEREELDNRVQTRSQLAERRGKAATDRTWARITDDYGLLRIHAGARKRAEEEQRRDARATLHRASSRKFLRSALPCCVITDSGWNWTPWTGCSR